MLTRANRDHVAALYDPRCRMWEFYLAACEASFSSGGLLVVQIRSTRKVRVLPMIRNHSVDAACGRANWDDANAADGRVRAFKCR